MGGPAKAHAPEIRHPPDDMGADGHLMGIKVNFKRRHDFWELSKLTGRRKGPVARWASRQSS